MNELDTLLQDVEKLRNNLHKLLEEKNRSLQDPEVITASQILNSAISKYNEVLEKKNRSEFQK